MTKIYGRSEELNDIMGDNIWHAKQEIMGKNEDTVEVPITWLEKLMELSKALDEDFPKTDRLKHLKGYIESAEFLIPKVSAIEQERNNYSKGAEK